MACSLRRREYFQRANRILATYATLSAYSAEGQSAIQAAATAGQISDATLIRVPVGEHTFQTTYARISAAFAKAGEAIDESDLPPTLWQLRNLCGGSRS